MKKFIEKINLLITRLFKLIKNNKNNCEDKHYDDIIEELVYTDEMLQNIKLKIDNLRIELEKRNINISRISRTHEAFCIVLYNGNIEIYMEYYYDGDIGLVVSDKKNKKIIDNFDLNNGEVLSTILKYYK